MQSWLLRSHFKHAVELSVLHVVPQPEFADPKTVSVFDVWTQAANHSAQGLVNKLAAAPIGPHYTATGE